VSKAAEEILDMLHSDLVQHSWVTQVVKNCGEGDDGTDVRSVLQELLTSRHVEIGMATSQGAAYVEFMAWQGTVNERIDRAIEAAAVAAGADKEFAYWLCLTQNVDRWEKDA
jgi:hypothetical protein